MSAAPAPEHIRDTLARLMSTFPWIKRKIDEILSEENLLIGHPVAEGMLSPTCKVAIVECFASRSIPGFTLAVLTHEHGRTWLGFESKANDGPGPEHIFATANDVYLQIKKENHDEK